MACAISSLRLGMRIRLFSVGTLTDGDSPTIAALNTSQQTATAGWANISRISHISFDCRNDSAFSIRIVTLRSAA